MWKKITTEYANTIKHMARRKIRIQNRRRKFEVWARWDSKEKCFFWSGGADAVYLDEPPDWAHITHIQVGA